MNWPSVFEIRTRNSRYRSVSTVEAIQTSSVGDAAASRRPRLLAGRSDTAVHPSTERTRSLYSSRSLLQTLDAFFRSPDTWLARGLAGIAAGRGSTYSRSVMKRALDLAIALPLILLVIPLICFLAAVNRLLSPRHPAFFRQERVGHGGETLPIVKIRSMVSGSRPGSEPADPTVRTTFGRFIRRHYLDELPQLLQVLSGRLSLVGIRVLPGNVYAGLAIAWSHDRFETWRTMYSTSPLGLTGAHQVFRGNGKHDSRRFHRDMFYARHTSLGFDLYLLWRTLGTTDSAHGHAPMRRRHPASRRAASLRQG